MEIASIITSSKNIISLFEEFILTYNKLQLQEKDSDTIYFSKHLTDKLEIYYHYLLNNVEDEFSYNYKEDDINKIRQHFKGLDIYIFDLSFRDNVFFQEMMRDFETFLSNRGEEYNAMQVLISHPHDGIITLPVNNKAAQ